VRTLHVGFNLAGTLALALVWFQLMRARDIAAIERLILLGIVLAALLLLPALFDILNLRELLVPDHNISKYNRGILILCVFAAVLVALALGSRRAAALGWAALALSAICAFASGSETSKMFLLAFPPLLAVFYLTERVSGWLSAAIPPLFYFAFPLLVTPMRLLLDAAEKAGFENILRESSAMARQEIWASFIAAAMERPILGWGLGSERYVPLAGKALQAGEMGPWTHAHSLPVQVLVHLGLTGFIVAGGVIIAVCLAIKNLPEASRAPAFALATAMLMVWSISHGAWQAWWLAVLVLALAPIFIQARGARA
jgi:O-antigen ligase